MKFIYTIVWIVIIFILSLLPGNSFKGIEMFVFSDKLVHVFMYFILSVAFFIDLSRNHSSKSKKYLIPLLTGIFIGALLEILQHYFIPNRTGNVYDLLADIVGSLLGIALAGWLYPWFKKTIS